MSGLILSDQSLKINPEITINFTKSVIVLLIRQKGVNMARKKTTGKRKSVIKSAAGRPRSGGLSDYAIDKLKGFIESYGSQKSLAKELGVSNALIWHWMNKRCVPSWQHMQQLEHLSDGKLTPTMLFMKDTEIICAPRTLKSFIEEDFLNSKAAVAEMGVEEYYKNFVPYIIRKIIDSGVLKESDLLDMRAFFGSPQMYWKRALLLYGRTKKK